MRGTRSQSIGIPGFLHPGRITLQQNNWRSSVGQWKSHFHPTSLRTVEKKKDFGLTLKLLNLKLVNSGISRYGISRYSMKYPSIVVS